jgi:glutamyl-tRNA reductase
LLVGTGQMRELAARNLSDNGTKRLTIINRTSENALDLAQRYAAVHRTFSELPSALIEADVVISSTSAPRALITHEMMQQVMRERNGRSLLLIDIALPRDVEPEVAFLDGVHLKNLDDLQASSSEGLRLRAQEIPKVEAIVAEEGRKFERWLNSLGVVDTISELRQYAESLRQQELARTMRQLAPSLSEREASAVQELTTRLLNKILHKPTSRLKDAAANGQGHLYAEALRYLFALEENTYENVENRNASQHAGHGADQLGDHAIAAALAEAGDLAGKDTNQGRSYN